LLFFTFANEGSEKPSAPAPMERLRKNFLRLEGIK